MIRGATVWRHLPAAKPVTPLSCENAAAWFYPIEEKHSSIEHLFLKVQSMTLHRRKGTLRAFSRSFRYKGIRTSGFWRMNTWNELFCSWICRWIHDVWNVWMNGWVLKKRSKDVLEELAENIKNIKPKNYNICMYVFIM